MAIKIYVASKVKWRYLWHSWRRNIPSNVQINARWLDVYDVTGDAGCAELWQTIVEDVRDCDALIVLRADGDEQLKGAYIEIGIALALGKPILAVGLDDHTFSKHPLVTCVGSVPDAFDIVCQKIK